MVRVRVIYISPSGDVMDPPAHHAVRIDFKNNEKGETTSISQISEGAVRGMINEVLKRGGHEEMPPTQKIDWAVCDDKALS